MKKYATLITCGTSIAKFVKDEKIDCENPEFSTDQMEYIRQNGESLSAEINVYTKIKKNLDVGLGLVLIGTNTNQFIKVLSKIFSEVFECHVDIREFHFNIDDNGVNKADIALYLSGLHGIVEQYLADGLVVALQGGYKFMVSTGQNIASLFNLPVYYVHEDGKALLEIPPLPIELNESVVDESFQDIAAVYSGEEIDLDEIRSNKSINFMFEVVDEIIDLNFYGKFIFETKLVPKHIVLSKDAMKMFEGIGGKEKSDLLDQAKKVYLKLLLKSNDSNQFHEMEFKGNINRKSDVHLYKLGNSQLRFIYSYRVDEFKIHHFWLNHDKYEREFISTYNEIVK